MTTNTRRTDMPTTQLPWVEVTINRNAAQALAAAWADGASDTEIVAAVRTALDGFDGHLVRLERALRTGA